MNFLTKLIKFKQFKVLLLLLDKKTHLSPQSENLATHLENIGWW